MAHLPPRQLLESRTERVAEVHEPTQTSLLIRIVREFLEHQLDGAANELGPYAYRRREAGAHQLGSVLAEPHEEVTVPDDGHLEHFGGTRSQFDLGQAAQEPRVDQNARRGAEGSEIVLVAAEVHRTLERDAGVD